jgi:UDP-N-acetylmuramyl tripeptide synthase
LITSPGPNISSAKIMRITEPLTYIGPNRRSEKTVIEWPLQLSSGELEAIRSTKAGCLQAIRFKLGELGSNAPAFSVEGGYAPGTNQASPILDAGHWVAVIALALQQAAGHRVFFRTVLPGPDIGRCRLIFEYEHAGTGADAGELALRILSESIPELEWESDNELAKAGIKDAYEAFLAEAGKHVLPLDAQAIIHAAERMDVPCVKLERDPYGDLEGDFRIRRNGLLKLGHSRYQHIVDGTLCVDQTPELAPLLFDREKMSQCMVRLGLPLPDRDREFRNVISARRAVRSAARIGYPVVLKPTTRFRDRESPGTHAYPALSSEAEVLRAFARISREDRRVFVEKHVTGATIHVLLAGDELVCIVDASGSPLPFSALHASILSMVTRAAKALNAGLLNVTLVTRDPGRPLAETDGAVVNLDPAPQLDRLLANEPELMATAAEKFVRWLYPPGTQSRTPLVAVTGTDGKTTTSRMISRIMHMAGFSPGMASTSGVYINETLHKQGDSAGSEGHHLLFESRDIDLCVLETARGAVANSGFMFDWCDVAVCLNVTYDHIGQYGIDTVEEMVALKRSVLERAHQAVVLNADYSTTRGMLPFATGVRVYLASLGSAERTIRKLTDGAAFACVLEVEDGEEWITLYRPGGCRSPVMPVAAIPTTFGGAARFNISNAQHAVCACHALGVDLEVMRQALGSFEACYENTPGRLNIYREFPFTVIMDFAHNMDGMEKFCAFTDQMDVPGRRILLCSRGGDRTDQEIADFTRFVIGHFDHFACRSYIDLHGRAPGEVAALMKATLLEAGVTEERITMVENPEEGTRQVLSMARPGDLVVLSPGTKEIDMMWQEVISFEPQCAG